MSMSPEISIAFPIYNPGRHLVKALNSILSQSFTNFEILLIDDGSRQNPFNHLQLVRDSRVRLIRHEENRGLAFRLNEAILLSRGKYVARMDQDDVCLPNRLQCQYTFLEMHPTVDLVAARCVIIDEHDNITGRLPYLSNDSSVACRPWQGFYFPHPTWMGKTSWFRSNPYAQPDPYRCEDQELLLRTHEQSVFYLIPEYLVAYRIGQKKGYSNNAMKTALSVFSFQIRYFIPKGRVFDCGLSFASLLCKLSKAVLTLVVVDLCRLHVLSCNKCRPIEPSLATYFKSLIDEM